MNNSSELLVKGKEIFRLYQKMSEKICLKYDMTMIEMNIIAFLANNPEYDTARDITEIRMLPKSNVSQAVENLIKKEMIDRVPDNSDRRIVHLHLTDNCDESVRIIRSMQSEFGNTLFDGFSETDKLHFNDFYDRISHNIQIKLELLENEDI